MLKLKLIKLNLYATNLKDNFINGKSSIFDKKIKGSYTIEAAILVPLLLGVFLVTCNLSIFMYQEINNEHEEMKIENMWEVNDFYLTQFNKDEPYVAK